MARATSLEISAASGSSSPDSARSWNFLGNSDGSTATGSLGSHGPGSSDDTRNTRRRLDTFSSPENEHARSAILLRFPCEQYHTGITNWINNLWEESNLPACNKPVRIHCKTGSLSVRLVFEARAKCQDFVARYTDDGFPYEVDSPVCQSRTLSQSASQSHLKTEQSGNVLRPLWSVWAEKLEALFLDGDDTGSFIVPALDVRSRVLSI